MKKEEDGHLFDVDEEGFLRWYDLSGTSAADDGGLDLKMVKSVDQLGTTITLVCTGRSRFSSLTVFKLEATSASAAKVETFAETLRKARDRRHRGTPMSISAPVEVDVAGRQLWIADPVEIRLPKRPLPLERQVRFVPGWRDSSGDHGTDVGEVWIKASADHTSNEWAKFRTGSKALTFKGAETGKFELEIWLEPMSSSKVVRDLLQLVRSRKPLILTFDVKSHTVRETVVAYMAQHMRYVIPRHIHQSMGGPGLVGVAAWCVPFPRSPCKSRSAPSCCSRLLTCVVSLLASIAVRKSFATSLTSMQMAGFGATCG